MTSRGTAYYQLIREGSETARNGWSGPERTWERVSKTLYGVMKPQFSWSLIDGLAARKGGKGHATNLALSIPVKCMCGLESVGKGQLKYAFLKE